MTIDRISQALRHAQRCCLAKTPDSKFGMHTLANVPAFRHAHRDHAVVLDALAPHLPEAFTFDSWVDASPYHLDAADVFAAAARMREARPSCAHALTSSNLQVDMPREGEYFDLAFLMRPKGDALSYTVRVTILPDGYFWTSLDAAPVRADVRDQAQTWARELVGALHRVGRCGPPKSPTAEAAEVPGMPAGAAASCCVEIPIEGSVS